MSFKRQRATKPMLGLKNNIGLLSMDLYKPLTTLIVNTYNKGLSKLDGIYYLGQDQRRQFYKGGETYAFK